MSYCPSKIQNCRSGSTLIRTRVRRNLVSVHAFTLIELLVVISIIGILATLLLANFMGTRQRARDVTRKSDINQIQKALEMYKFNQTPSKYPDTNPWIDALQDTAGGGANATMKTVPNDPLCPGGNCSGSAVVYSYERDASDNLKYTLIACLENASDQQKDAVKNAYCSAQAASLTRTEP